ncbi:Hint domain-containing protein [Celeribacter arenosi]|uniref:Hedgehog/Intein (Hint) domain-containing protein n=1 Tax=Celeribacter arenosi TaxID=792649 RepID=A0ABP7KG26_9RHOB
MGYSIKMYDANAMFVTSPWNPADGWTGSDFITWSKTGDHFGWGAGGVTFSSFDSGVTVAVSDNDTLFEDDDASWNSSTPQTLTDVTTIGSTTYTQGVDVEDEYEVTLRDPDTNIEYRLVVVSINDTPATLTFEGPLPPTGVMLSYVSHADGQSMTPPVCFGAGTLIKTTRGEIAVEKLAVGDRVVTADSGLQRINWIGLRKMNAQMLNAAPQYRAIRIRAGSLGGNTPEIDLIVSPQHRILVSSKIVERMSGEQEALVAAKHLLGLEGVDIAEDLDEVTYVHFLLERHEIVFSNGALTESLYTGAEAMKSLSEDARQEIFGLFPELAITGTVTVPARRLMNGREGRKMAQRHVKNGVEVVRRAS